MYKRLKKFRSAILVYLTHSMALPLLKIIRKPEIFPYSKEQLQQFEEGSLGKDLICFLQKKELELLPYYARHDIKHILLQYDTTDDGEVCLQAFMMGNGHISFPVLATVFYGYITMPEHWNKFKAAWCRGKNAKPISHWKWFEILSVPTVLLRQQIIRPQ
jgi:ubiquinone biosynthesis protein Coq4